MRDTWRLERLKTKGLQAAVHQGVLAVEILLLHYTTGEREWSGGNFVTYSQHPRVVTALFLLISEPQMGCELHSEHSISDIPFIYVDKEQQTLYPQCSHCLNFYISVRFSNSSLQTLIISLPFAWKYYTASRPRSIRFEPPQQPPIEQKFQGLKLFNFAIKALNISTRDVMQLTSGAEPGLLLLK